MKHLANYITASRFVFAGLLLLTEPFSGLFWAWYLCGGISDLLDGPVARKLRQQSAFGAKLDSAADFAFIVCAVVAILPRIDFPDWALVMIGAIVLVRCVTYGVGYMKYRTFATMHTYLNKATGFLLLLFPVLFWLTGINAASGIIGGIALLAAIEELTLMILSQTLDRDRKSIFTK
ncbi:MAG: CDP-alcohol phosphatidyltransferase family protein [Clostridiales bacterium]|nr:CDP-alcohol phosphatidyltransferase family protein [Clostridiales bacterium]